MPTGLVVVLFVIEPQGNEHLCVCDHVEASELQTAFRGDAVELGSHCLVEVRSEQLLVVNKAKNGDIGAFFDWIPPNGHFRHFVNGSLNKKKYKNGTQRP